jgi:hypothetical protein
MIILEIDLASSCFSPSLSQISDEEMSTEVRQEGGRAQDPSGKIIAPWTFDVKFPLGTQFTFESLMFAAWEDGDLRMLPPGPELEHLMLVPGQAPCFLATSSTSGGVCSGLDLYAGHYIPIVMSILWPSAGASSSSSSAASPDQDSSDDYQEIRMSTCGDSAGEGRLIFMVAPVEEPPRNSSTRYPIIGRLEASDAQMPNNAMIQNLNPEFNVVRL